MQAIIINRFGGPEVFEIAGVPTPYAGEGEIVIRVEASSVNPVDYKIRDGRAAFLAPSFPAILHPDCAGVVSDVGQGVTTFEPGDRVMSFATGLVGKHGALAEFMLADARMVARIPDKLSFEQAAALPLVSVTSWYNIVEATEIDPGTSVLIMGGTGGVGHIALQLAKWKGAYVVAACGSRENCEAARRLGADDALNYRDIDKEQYADYALGGEGFDVVFNTPGLPSIDASVAAAKFGGVILDILGEFPTETGFQAKWLTFKSTFAGHEIVFGTDPSRVGGILTDIARLASLGIVTPLIDPQQFPFSMVGAAHEYAEHGSPVGKVVLRQDLCS